MAIHISPTGKTAFEQRLKEDLDENMIETD
jgi:hypothetical protein